MMINKKFKSIMDFLSVTNLVGEWNQRTIDDYVSQENLTFCIVENLDFIGGFHVAKNKFWSY